MLKNIFIFFMMISILGCSGENKQHKTINDNSIKSTSASKLNSINDITITIQPDGDKMLFKQKEFTVEAGQKVTIVMDNIATIKMMKHNVVILNDETKIQEVGMKALSAPGNIPDHPAIIAATPMADIGQKTSVTFTAPKTAGNYPYICTFPGHYSLMKGIMIVK